MNTYKIKFMWVDDPIIIKYDTLKDVIKYLYDFHMNDISDMNRNGEVGIWQSEKETLTWYNIFGPSYWYNLDTGEELSYEEELELKKTQFKENPSYKLKSELERSHQKIIVNDLTYRQFENYIKFLFNETDDYGNPFILIFQKLTDHNNTNEEWNEIDEL